MRKKRVVHSRKKKASHGKRRIAQERLAPKDWRPLEVVETEPMGLGPGAAGQSGDIEGLPDVALGDSESVAELVEEGQDLEAEKVSGIENVPDADEEEVTAQSAEE